MRVLFVAFEWNDERGAYFLPTSFLSFQFIILISLTQMYCYCHFCFLSSSLVNDTVFECGIDGVIVALGGKTSDVGDTMLTVGTNNVMSAMKSKGVKRIAVVTSIGAGDSKDQAPFAFKLLMMTVMKKIFTDKNNQEKAVLESGLEYCIVRPGGLTVEPPTGVINVIDGEAGSIPRADVAQFCLEAVKDANFPYVGMTPCISSVGGTSWVKDRSKAARGQA